MRPLTKINNKVNLYRPLLDIKKKFLKKITKIVFGKFMKEQSNNDDNFL